MDTTAIVLAIISLLSSVFVTIYSTLRSEKQNKEIEILKNKLSLESAEKNARRDYEYEAKKRLYAEYEPLFFQLAELSNQARHHLKGMSWTTFNSLKDPESWDRDQWMEIEAYYFRETIYKVFSPFAMFNILLKKVNSFDVSIDRKVHIVYSLGKILYFTFSHDYIIAGYINRRLLINEEHTNKFGPNFKVGNPFGEAYVNEWRRNVITNPENFSGGEGIRTGQLDNIINGFIYKDENVKRILTFSEFEKKLSTNSNDWIQIAALRFSRFDPKTNQVLWRVLLVQACIHYIISGIKTESNVSRESVIELGHDFFKRYRRDIDKDKKAGFKGNIVDRFEQNDVIDAAEKYLMPKLKRI